MKSSTTSTDIPPSTKLVRSNPELKVPIHKALYWKLILALFLISTFVACLQYLGYRVLIDSFLDKLIQTTFWDVAQKFEQDVKSYTSPSIKTAQIEKRIFEYQWKNPMVDIYLLDAAGKVILSPHPQPRLKVPLEPVLEFLQVKGYPVMPIYGVDPHSQNCRIMAPISAAPIRLASKNGYVYAVLRSRLYREVYHTFGDLWLTVFSAIYLFILTLSTIALGMIFFYLITRRFRALTIAIKRFTGGDYSSRASGSSDDEMGLHARAFNEMADTVQRNINDLKENDRLRRELIANVSHDIRTPLAAMQALLESLRSKYSSLPQETRMRFLDRALSNCSDLTVLVDDLFELSKLEARTRQPEMSPINLREFLPNIAKNFAIKAEDKELDLILRLPDSLPSVLADERMLNRAVGNLVQNAIRYTDSGGQVRIEALATGTDAVTISVSDTGVGIPEEDLKTIFDRFYRGARVSDMEKSGFGLGLAITKRIMDLHNQSISVESTEGKGSIFSISLACLPNDDD